MQLCNLRKNAAMYDAESYYMQQATYKQVFSSLGLRGCYRLFFRPRLLTGPICEGPESEPQLSYSARLLMLDSPSVRAVASLVSADAEAVPGSGCAHLVQRYDAHVSEWARFLRYSALFRRRRHWPHLQCFVVRSVGVNPFFSITALRRAASMSWSLAAAV